MWGGGGWLFFVVDYFNIWLIHDVIHQTMYDEYIKVIQGRTSCSNEIISLAKSLGFM